MKFFSIASTKGGPVEGYYDSRLAAKAAVYKDIGQEIPEDAQWHAVSKDIWVLAINNTAYIMGEHELKGLE